MSALFPRMLAAVWLTGGLFAADWRDALATRPGKFPPLRAVTAQYEFGWSGVKAAEAEAKFTAGKGRFRLELDARTVGLARGLWRMDMRGVSTVDARTLRPVKLEQTEKYARKSFEITAGFSPEGVERVKKPTPPDKQPPKPKRFKFGNVHDLHSALLFVRSQPLAEGDVVRLCVYPSSSAYYAEVEVRGRDKVRTAGREWSAIKCDIRLREVGKEFALAPHKKFKNATAWLSDDADRLLLRIEAEVFVGKIWVGLKLAEFAK